MSGNEAEAAILGALVRRKFEVLVPFGDGYPYDLGIRLKGTTLLRVQCKTAWPSCGCLIFNCLATDHGRGPQPYFGRADIFGVYLPLDQSVYLVPIDAVASSEGRLRLEPTRNNQKRGIRLASDFEIDRWTTDALCKVADASLRATEEVASVA